MANKVLIVEDEPHVAEYFKKVLISKGFYAKTASTGIEAIEMLNKISYDLVITDWLMPKLSGLELIKRVRRDFTGHIPIIMITTMSSEKSETTALDSGADYFLRKPVKREELADTAQRIINQTQQKSPQKKISYEQRASQSGVIPPFIGVFIATSTGGPPVITELLKKLPESQLAPYFIVQHGPDWMFEPFIQRLNQETGHIIHVAKDRMAIEPGHVYIAPGDFHMEISNKYEIKLTKSPKENFCRPSADPMFRSAAIAFGKYSIGLILTGLGRDGAAGAGLLQSAGGKIFVQDPTTAIAPSMPESALKAGYPSKKIHIKDIPNQLWSAMIIASKQLKEDSKS